MYNQKMKKKPKNKLFLFERYTYRMNDIENQTEKDLGNQSDVNNYQLNESIFKLIPANHR